MGISNSFMKLLCLVYVTNSSNEMLGVVVDVGWARASNENKRKNDIVINMIEKNKNERYLKWAK
jgi:hypothetical protein